MRLSNSYHEPGAFNLLSRREDITNPRLASPAWQKKIYILMLACLTDLARYCSRLDSWRPRLWADSFTLKLGGRQWRQGTAHHFWLQLSCPSSKDISFIQVWCQQFKLCCLITVLIPLPYYWLMYFCYSELFFPHRDFKTSVLRLSYLTFSIITFPTRGHTLSLQWLKCWVESLSGQLLNGLLALRGFVKAHLNWEDGSCHGIDICTYDMFVNLVSC